MSILYAITHAEATHHIDRKVGGWYDSELTPRGHRDAERIAALLRSRIDGIPVLYSSDLMRAQQTAAPIAKVFSRAPELSADLREASCGVAEGRPSAWLEERIVRQPSDGNRLDHRICEGAESRREVATRVYRFVGRLLEAPPDTTVVVTHGFALTFVICAWLGVPLETLGSMRYSPASGGITRLDIDREWGERKLVSFNETGHLGA